MRGAVIEWHACDVTAFSPREQYGGAGQVLLLGLSPALGNPSARKNGGQVLSADWWIEHRPPARLAATPFRPSPGLA